MFRQITAVCRLSLKSIPQRLGASIVVVIGIAAVVGVLVSVFTMARSWTLKSSGISREMRIERQPRNGLSSRGTCM